MTRFHLQPHLSPGFTLIEVMLVITLVGILASLTISIVTSLDDKDRYEATRLKMEQIRDAIIGNRAVDSQGNRISFGYVGDWGGLPNLLSNLTTSQSPAWSFNSTYGFGTGWKGPYAKEQWLGEWGIEKDGWNRNFIWSQAGIPPTLTSYGSDGMAGGTSFAKDLILTFPDFLWRGTVRGAVLDERTPVADRTVEIRYASLGQITFATTTTNANGLFSFANIPFGSRSLALTSGTPLIAAKAFLVQKSEQEVSPDLLNFQGMAQKITYNAGSADYWTLLGMSLVTASFTSTYNSNYDVGYLTLYWDRPSAQEPFLRTIWLPSNVISGIDVLDLPSGARIPISVSRHFLPNSALNFVTFRFVDSGGGTINMSNATISASFERLTSGEQESVTYPAQD